MLNKIIFFISALLIHQSVFASAQCLYDFTIFGNLRIKITGDHPNSSDYTYNRCFKQSDQTYKDPSGKFEEILVYRCMIGTSNHPDGLYSQSALVRVPWTDNFGIHDNEFGNVSLEYEVLDDNESLKKELSFDSCKRVNM